MASRDWRPKPTWSALESNPIFLLMRRLMSLNMLKGAFIHNSEMRLDDERNSAARGLLRRLDQCGRRKKIGSSSISNLKKRMPGVSSCRWANWMSPRWVLSRVVFRVGSAPRRECRRFERSRHLPSLRCAAGLGYSGRPNPGCRNGVCMITRVGVVSTWRRSPKIGYFRSHRVLLCGP